MRQTIADVASKGDPARGELVFRSKAAGCYQCHAIGGSGGTLAPDLRAVGAASPVDYLIDSILQPNKALKDGYDSILVTTNDGDVIQGIKVARGREGTGPPRQPAGRDRHRHEQHQVTPARRLADAAGTGGRTDPRRVPRPRPIPERARQAGAVRGAERRRHPPVARCSTRCRKGSRPADSTPPAGDAGWWPAYTLVAGVLPPDALANSGKGVAFARCQVEVTSPGKVRLLLNSPKGLRLWADDRPVDVTGPEVTLDLPRGVRTLTFRIDPTARGNEGLRAELADAPGSAGHAQPVGGK